MNRMIVVREDNIVIVDGEVRTVDLSDLVDERIHAIQWYGDHGQVEYEGRGLLNSDFQDPIILEELMVAWEAAKPVEPDPVPEDNTIIPYGNFRLRWEPEELEALHAARQQDWRVDDFVGLAQAQGNVNLGGDTAAQAKALFVSLGVLTEDRADTIFAP